MGNYMLWHPSLTSASPSKEALQDPPDDRQASLHTPPDGRQNTSAPSLFKEEEQPEKEWLFPIQKDRTWTLPLSKMAEYQATFGAKCDVHQKLREARQWLLDNPSRRKTAKGMPRFLGGWLHRHSNGNSKPNGGLEFTETHRQSASSIWGRIHKRFPELPEPNLDEWANDVRLIQEDGHSLGQIRDIFLRACYDTFWTKVILSPAHLRKHWHKLSQLPKNPETESESVCLGLTPEEKAHAERYGWNGTPGGLLCHYDPVVVGRTVLNWSLEDCAYQMSKKKPGSTVEDVKRFFQDWYEKTGQVVN